MHPIIRSVYRAIPFALPAFKMMRAVGLVPPFHQRMNFRGVFTVEMSPGHSFRMFSDRAVIETSLFWEGYGKGWEGCSLRLWHLMCRKLEGLALDVGANVGVYSLAAAASSQKIQPVAFEPVPRLCQRIRRNAALNSFPITIEEKAVSDKTETRFIFDTMEEINYSASLDGQGPSASSYPVQVVTVDDYVQDRAVAAVKIDVERHERAVLLGMQRTIEQQHPPMLIEVLDEQVGRQVAQLAEGYDFYHIAEEGGLSPVDELRPRGRSDWNHLLCTKEQFTKLSLDRFMSKSV